MDQEDAAQLLPYLHERLRDAGLDELADQLVEASGTDAAPPGVEVVRALAALEAELRARDAGTAREVLTRLRDTTHTEPGLPPQGLWLDLSPAHRALFGIDGAELTEGPELSAIIGEVAELRLSMEQEFL
jgi:hypothetical protein